MNGGAPFDLVAEGRAGFLEMARDIRPALHRYCARMTGSVFDGEDIVQETLARAFFELPQLKEVPALKGWLFRIAHNAALDWVRADVRRGEIMAARTHEEEVAEEERDTAEDTYSRRQGAQVALSAFVKLPATQRACVILKDVLAFSLEEIAELLTMSVPAVKSALHRGRSALPSARDPEPVPAREALAERYAALFAARDWAALKAILAEDVRLDLVSQWKRIGRDDVSDYFTNYRSRSDWSARFAVLEGRPGVLVARQAGAYFIVIEGHDSVAAIRDYRYCDYMFADVVF